MPVVQRAGAYPAAPQQERVQPLVVQCKLRQDVSYSMKLCWPSAHLCCAIAMEVVNIMSANNKTTLLPQTVPLRSAGPRVLLPCDPSLLQDVRQRDAAAVAWTHEAASSLCSHPCSSFFSSTCRRLAKKSNINADHGASRSVVQWKEAEHSEAAE